MVSWTGYPPRAGGGGVVRSFFETYFTQPWLLLLLPLVPLVLRRWLRRARPALRYSNTALLATLPAGRSRLAYWGPVALRAVALVALVLGLAGLRWPDASQRIPTEGIAMVLLVDVSGSMDATDFDWQGERVSRLEAVKRAFRLFIAGGAGPDGTQLDGRPNDLMALIPFARRPEPGCPLTLSHSVLLKVLDKEKPRTITEDMSTNITDAMIMGLSRLEGAARKRRVIVLLSDGEDNVPVTAAPEVRTTGQAANLAASLQIPVYTIDAGGDGGSPLEPGAAEAGQRREGGIKSLRSIAKTTGGHYFQARDTKSLLDVCKQIDGMEREEILSYQYGRYFQAFPWLGLTAFVLLIAVHVLEMTLWQRLPA